jgi:hypothetical protein
MSERVGRRREMLAREDGKVSRLARRSLPQVAQSATRAGMPPCIWKAEAQVCGESTGNRRPGARSGSTALLEHEGKDDGDHEDALQRVTMIPVHALWKRRVG